MNNIISKKNNNFLYFPLFLCIFFLQNFNSFVNAQFLISPNQTFYKKNTSPNNIIYMGKPALQLPFFEDFSLYQGVADTTIWEKNGGTYINQYFGINNPSLGMATFDGLNEQGQPYNFSTVVSDAIGLTDVLQSFLINMSALTPADSVYLSFYYQKAGLGEMPDVVDSLVIQGKDNLGNWTRLWSQTGGQRNTDYTQVMIPIRQSKYFHNAFQFRFQAYGRQSGMYDVWNVDYIYMNKNRSSQDIYVEEIATTKPATGWLKKYSAMPAPHFWLNPTVYLADKFTSAINNFSGVGFDVPSYNATAKEIISGLNLGFFASTSPFILAGNAQQFEITANTNLSALPLNKKMIIESQFLVNSGDNSTTIQGIDLRRNDITRNTTYITDFFAYDDGTAEYGAGVNQRFGKCAVRFFLEKPDTLTDIRVHLTKFEKDLSNLSVNFVVWQQLFDPTNGINKDSIIYKVNVPVRYPNLRNQLLSVDSLKRIFTSTFRFPQLRLPRGIFYIGWEQTTNDRITVGYDMNSDATGEIFFNTGNLWQTWQPDATQKGALMIRPIFSKDNLTPLENIFTTNKNNALQENIILFPNPAKDECFVKISENNVFSTNYKNDFEEFFKNNLKEIRILDLEGREKSIISKEILAKNLENFSNENPLKINLVNLPSGVYLIKMDFGKGNFLTKKVVKN